MRQKSKKTVKWLLLTPCILLGLYLLYALIVFTIAGVSSAVLTPTYRQNQIDRIASLEAGYNDGSIARVNEDDFVTDGGIGEDVRLNELRYIATHNSYKQKLSPVNHFFLNYVTPYFGLNNGRIAYDYGFETLTDQFNNGIRSIELDIHKTYGGEYQCYHHALLDNNSSAVSIALAFKEIAMWSAYNKGHLPLMILLEPKAGTFLFATKETVKEDLETIGNMARDTFGDSLYTPGDMLRGAGVDDFKSLTSKGLYPSVNTLRGKVMFMLYPFENEREYIDADKSMMTQPFFTTINANKVKDIDAIDTTYSCFAVCNDPTREYMNELTDRYNLIVRTRLNIYPKRNDEWYNIAMDSRANILSTDFPPRSDIDIDYKTYIRGTTKTITTR